MDGFLFGNCIFYIEQSYFCILLECNIYILMDLTSFFFFYSRAAYGGGIRTDSVCLHFQLNLLIVFHAVILFTILSFRCGFSVCFLFVARRKHQWKSQNVFASLERPGYGLKKTAQPHSIIKPFANGIEIDQNDYCVVCLCSCPCPMSCNVYRLRGKTQVRSRLMAKLTTVMFVERHSALSLATPAHAVHTQTNRSVFKSITLDIGHIRLPPRISQY